jgi:type I restriction enzyme, S subunit
VSDLPPGWVEAPLSLLGRWYGGGTPSKRIPAFWQKGTLPWVSPKDMKVDVIQDSEDHITEAALRVSTTNLIDAGAVLVVTRSGILQHTLPVAITSRPVTINQDLKALTPYPGLVPEYIAWGLRAHAQRILRECSKAGTTVQSVETTQLLRFVLSIAPTAEQERIVAAIEEHFSRLDAGVAALARVKQNLERQRESLLSKLAEKASEWTTLGEIADIVGGVTKDVKRQMDPAFIDVPYLRVANVQRGYLDLDVVTTIRVPRAQAEKLYLQPGDILFNEGGDRDKLGRGWVWQGEIRNCIHQNHVFRARLTSPAFEPKFISLHGNTFGRRWFELMGKQTTNLASLNLTTLKSFPVPILPIAEQENLVAAAEQQASVKAALALALDHAGRRAQKLRSAILASAFSGNLVPHNSNDEPAALLLKRATAERASFKSPGRVITRMPQTTG